MRTNEDKKRFLEILEKIPFVSHASKQAGIDKATIYRWIKKDKKFKNKVEEALDIGRAGMCDIAESKVVSMINQGEFRACKFYLENNDKRYIKPRPINVFVDKGSVNTLSKEDKEKLNRLLSP